MGSAATNEPCSNITVQNCLFGECRDAMYIGNGNLSPTTAGEIGSVSLLRNAFSNVGWRVPGNPVGTSAAGKSFDFVNNIAHNFWYRTFRIAGVAPHLNLIGNYYQAGTHTETQFPSEIGLQELPLFVANSEEMTGAKIYMFDNPIESVNVGYSPLDYLSPKTGSAAYSLDASGTTTYPESVWFPFGSSNTTPIAASNQFLSTQEIALTNPHPVLLRASDVASTILPDIGANKYLNADGTVGVYRDDLDTMYVNWIINGTSSSYQSSTKTPPANMPSSSRPAGYDTDLDGIPDTYEIAQGWDETIANNNVLDASGYTQLQLFLNEVDTGSISDIPVITITGNNPETVNLNDSYTDAGATASDYTDGDLTSIIATTGTVDTSIVGTYYIYYNVTDSNQNAATQQTRTINVIDNSGDVSAPTTPTALTPSNTTSSSVTISWIASTDDVAVTGYRVYKDGDLASTVTGGTTYNATSLSSNTEYSFTVSAIDASSNESAQSTALSVTTSATATIGTGKITPTKRLIFLGN